MYVGIYLHIYIYRERERVITVKKTTYLKNIFNSRLYQFIVFAFFLYRYIKYFLQFLQLISNKRLKSCGKKIFSENDS